MRFKIDPEDIEEVLMKQAGFRHKGRQYKHSAWGLFRIDAKVDKSIGYARDVSDFVPSQFYDWRVEKIFGANQYINGIRILPPGIFRYRGDGVRIIQLKYRPQKK